MRPADRCGVPDSVPSEPDIDTLLWLALGQGPFTEAVAAQGTNHAVQLVAVSCNAAVSLDFILCKPKVFVW